MTIDDLATSTGEWLRGEGPMSDVVISSRIRLARNLADRPFLLSAGSTERTEIYRCVVDHIVDGKIDPGGTVIDLLETDAIDHNVLVERHLISRQHVTGEGSRGVAVSRDERRAIMINEEDHLRIQALRSGLQLDDLFTDVNTIDDQLSTELPFAFDKKLGYLTACPTNVGTGIRVSVMLHLPALRLTKEIERVARAARDLHLAVRGLYGEGTEAVGDLYQVSNQTTLGKSEDTIVRTFSEKIIPKIVEYERTARDTLTREHVARMDDKIWRAYGLLCNARRMSSNETHTLLSPIRMGIHMGRFDRFDLRLLNELFLFTQPAHLQKTLGRSIDEDDRNVARADYIRSRLN